MKDQHTKIKGYRDLSQEEIDLMNKIKAHAEKTAELINEVHLLRDAAIHRDWDGFPISRNDGLTNEQGQESDRCLGLAKNYLQTGQMWFVRAVALPNSF